VKTVSGRVVTSKAFIGLSISAKMVDEGCPLLRENLAKTDPPFWNCQFPINICS